MTTFQHKPGSGNAFPNKFKSEDRHPDYKGQLAQLDGKLVDIAIWEGETSAGDKKLSFKVSEPRAKSEPAQAVAPNKNLNF